MNVAESWPIKLKYQAELSVILLVAAMSLMAAAPARGSHSTRMGASNHLDHRMPPPSATRAIPRILTLVPPGNWVYQSIDRLINRQLLDPGDLYSFGRIMTRRDGAILTAIALTDMKCVGIASGRIEREDLKTIQKLIVEFSDELAQLFSDEMSAITNKVSELERKLDIMPRRTHIRVEDGRRDIHAREHDHELRSLHIDGNFRISSEYVHLDDVGLEAYKLDHPGHDRYFNEQFYLRGQVQERPSGGFTPPGRLDFDLRGFALHTPGAFLSDWNIHWRNQNHDFIAGRALGVIFSPLTLYNQCFEGINWTYRYGSDELRTVYGKVKDSSDDQEHFGFNLILNHTPYFRNEVIFHQTMNYDGQNDPSIRDKNIMALRSTGLWKRNRRLSVEAARSQFHSSSDNSGVEGAAFRVEGITDLKKLNFRGEYTVTGQNFLNLNNTVLNPQGTSALYSRNDMRFSGQYAPDKGIVLGVGYRSQNRKNNDSDADLKILEWLADFKVGHLPRLMLVYSGENDRGTDTGAVVDMERTTLIFRGIHDGLERNRAEAMYKTVDAVDHVLLQQVNERGTEIDVFQVLPNNWDVNVNTGYRQTDRIAGNLRYNLKAGGFGIIVGYDPGQRNRFEGSFNFENASGYEEYRTRKTGLKSLYRRGDQNHIEFYAYRKQRDDRAYTEESYTVNRLGLEWTKSF